MKTRDHHTSEDLTQETFFRIHEKHSNREIGKRIAYLYVIARNLCNDYFRSGKRNEIPTENQQEEEDFSARISFEQVEIQEALGRLDKEERELILLRYINEESVGRISEIMQISRFTAYRRIKTALAHLRENM